MNPMECQPPNGEKPETSDSKSDTCEGDLASLLGTFNDDPAWHEVQEHIEEYRRQMDELNKG